MEQGHEGRRTLVVGKVSIRHVLLVYFADPMDLAQDDDIVELVVDGKADVREAGSVIRLTVLSPLVRRHTVELLIPHRLTLRWVSNADAGETTEAGVTASTAGSGLSQAVVDFAHELTAHHANLIDENQTRGREIRLQFLERFVSGGQPLEDVWSAPMNEAVDRRGTEAHIESRTSRRGG